MIFRRWILNDDTKDHDDICLPSALMQDCVKTSHWHILRDHHLGMNKNITILGTMKRTILYHRWFIIVTNHHHHYSHSPDLEVSYSIQGLAARSDEKRFGAEIEIISSNTNKSWGYEVVVISSQVHRGWIFTLGYSSLKSLEILGVHSRRARIFAAISFPCKRKPHQSH